MTVTATKTTITSAKMEPRQDNRMDLSFSGAGFMGCYYFGVVDCWNKYIPRERINRVAGASAGSLIAAYYLMDLPLSACLGKIIAITEDIRRRPLGVFDRSNQIVDVLPRVLDELLPEDAHKRVNGRLFVCMTRLKGMKKVMVSEFESKKDLIEALNCSCFIPVWSGNHVSTFRGVKHIDGGFSDNLPVFDEHTIRICCFSGQTDISPYDRAKMELLSGKILNTPFYLNLANCRRGRKALFPPPASYIVSLIKRGFQDTKDFILSNDLIQCDQCYRSTDLRHQPVFSRPSPTITPAASPNVSRSPSFRAIGDQPRSFGALLSPNGHSISHQGSFRTLLADKLAKCPAEDTDSKGVQDEDKEDATQVTPSVRVMVEEEDEAIGTSGDSSNASSPDSGNSSPRNIKSLAERRLGQRRNTVQLGPNQLIVDTFTLAPTTLPSCPPSPNLNRHCTECIRMRQEARMDSVTEDIMREAARYNEEEPPSGLSGGLKSKLTSPLRWIRQLGVKTSYKLHQPEPATAQQVAGG